MKKIIAFVKKETVLCVAWILAAASAFFVTPGREYIDYIDFKSLCTLWSLMIVVAGLTEEGLFDRIGKAVLARTESLRQLFALLVFLPFIFAMFITNDVALLTFVPFSMHILKMSGKTDRLIPVVAFQTIAANLGSMMTPIGNPQNIYLYGISGMNLGEFILLMLPYTLLSALLLLICVFIFSGKEKLSVNLSDTPEHGTGNNVADAHKTSSGRKTAVYGILFVTAVLSVALPKIFDYRVVAGLILIICLFMKKRILVSIDYALLFTFVGFFIFTGNLGRVDSVRDFLVSLVCGHEVISSVISSQFISNVPAALLLSEFTEKVSALIIGVNLGGLGTLIASMASLISFKLLAHACNEKKGRYLLFFTGASLVFLLILLGLYLVCGRIL